MPLNEAPTLQPVVPPPSAPQLIDAGEKDSLRQQLLLESDAMARYAFSAGLKLPPEVLQSLSVLEEMKEGHGASNVPLGEIGAVHAQLAVVVAPSLPRTIYLLQSDRARKGWLSILGPLPTVRRLMLAALFFTLVFVLSSLTKDINVVTMGLDIYRMDGLILLNVLVFLMSAAGMGATFNALFTAHSCIANGTYDARFESSFWSQIGLGVIAGLVISQIVPLGQESLQLSVLSEGYDPAEIMKQFKGTEEATASLISKPVLALVGGFSSTMVYTVLQRLVTTLESLFKSAGAESRAEREQMVRDIVAQKLGAYAAPHVPAAKPNGVPSTHEPSAPNGAQPTGTVVPFSPQGQSFPQPKEGKE
jgi:hypothetical protein